MLRQVIIYRGEDGYWVAECPSLPGCVSQGTTKEEEGRRATDSKIGIQHCKIGQERFLVQVREDCINTKSNKD